MAVSRFKATCLAVLRRVGQTGRSVRVTRFGKPVADIVPPRTGPAHGGWLGCMAGRAEILGDVVGSVVDAGEWKALRK